METNQHIYILEQEGKSYLITTSVFNNNIRLSCKNSLSGSDKEYYIDLTVEKFIKLHNLLNSIKTPIQAIQYLDKIITTQNFDITELYNKIIISFYITIKGITSQINIHLSDVKQAAFNSIENENFQQFGNIQNYYKNTQQQNEYEQYFQNINYSPYNNPKTLENENINYFQTSYYYQENKPFANPISNNDINQYNVDETNQLLNQVKTKESQKHYIHFNEKINYDLPKDTHKINVNGKNKDLKTSQANKKEKIKNSEFVNENKALPLNTKKNKIKNKIVSKSDKASSEMPQKKIASNQGKLKNKAKSENKSSQRSKIDKNINMIGANIFDVKNKYIMKEIFSNIKIKKLLNIIKYNRIIKDKLDIDINDYEEFLKINLELIPKLNINNNSKNTFINIPVGEESYYHIYFNDEKEEQKRNYFYKNDNIKIIKIIIDYYANSFYELFANCNCIESISFTRFNFGNIVNMGSMFKDCRSL